MNLSGFQIENIDEIDSPALLLLLERVEENVRRMIAMTGNAERLRPHVKTHKIPELIQLQRNFGITRFKCATIAEAEMLAMCGAPDVLLAYQPVGPKVGRFLQLMREYPETDFSTIADDPRSIEALSAAAKAARVRMDLLLDIDCGMNRCGIRPGSAAIELYRRIHASPGLKAGGLHVYDGHIHHQDTAERARACEEAFAPAQSLRDELAALGMPVPRMVVGGTPTFPMHARRPGVECSPGTCIFWDWGYGSRLPDLDFLPAAVLLSRVISKPGENRLCLDLGHKSIASENPHPRVHFPDLPDAKAVGHSEEHLVLETARAGEFQVGHPFLGIPWHVCPTVALHQHAVVVRNGRAGMRWQIVGRDRMISI
jgi:D-serine deaminase-like pyridoxal phosphate-dependent protein